MKVLWLRPSKGDNISVRRERIADQLRQRGYEIDIIDSSGLDGVTAVRTALFGNYDVIAGNVRVGLYLGYPLSRIVSKPLVGDVSDNLSDIDYLPSVLYRFFSWYEWEVLKRAEATVFVEEESFRKATEIGVSNPRRLPNAVDYELFSEPAPTVISEAESLLRKEGVSLNKPMAIYIGVFSERYCIPEVLEAADHLPEWDFVFVGQAGIELEVRKKAASTGNVHFPGAFRYELMPGFLSLADVGLCFKDGREALKLKEYGAAGLPIMARPGRMSEKYEDDELIFVDPSPTDIAGSLRGLLKDEQKYQSYVRSSRAIGRETSWERIATGYDEIFTELVRD
jgi:hypothetical protein